MNTTRPGHSREVDVLRWFERALEQPAAERSSWLAQRDLPEWLARRVARLLEAEVAAGDFLDAPVPGTRIDVAFPRPGERLGAYELCASSMPAAWASSSSAGAPRRMSSR